MTVLTPNFSSTQQCLCRACSTDAGSKSHRTLGRRDAHTSSLRPCTTTVLRNVFFPAGFLLPLKVAVTKDVTEQTNFRLS
jgi:hypothetical protein